MKILVLELALPVGLHMDPTVLNLMSTIAKSSPDGIPIYATNAELATCSSEIINATQNAPLDSLSIII